MRCVASAVLSLVAILTTAPAAAQHLSLDIREGRVTLDARDVTLPQILAEWTRVGGVRVVSDDRMSTSPLTLLLRDMSEREALDILLRGQAGYMLLARKDVREGTSAFESILILASSTPPTAVPTATRIGAAPERQEALAASIESADETVDVDVDQPTAQAAEAAPIGGSPAVGGTSTTPSMAAPPTPMLPPPPPRPTAGNPFAARQGSAAPGAGTPVRPPAGVYYPPVTNPDLFKSGGAGQPGR